MSIVLKAVSPFLDVSAAAVTYCPPPLIFSYIYKPYQLFKAYEIPGPPPRPFFGCYKELAAFSEASYQCINLCHSSHLIMWDKQVLCM